MFPPYLPRESENALLGEDKFRNTRDHSTNRETQLLF